MDRHGLTESVGRRSVIVGDPDLPAVAGRRTGDGDVAAEADQDAAAQGARDQAGTVIGMSVVGASGDLVTACKRGLRPQLPG